MIIPKDDPESQKTWADIQKVADEVKTWPAWKHAGRVKKTIIVVNRRHVAHNRRHPEDRKPVISINEGGKIRYADEVVLNNARLVYRPDRPLKCGATVYIETYEDLKEE